MIDWVGRTFICIHTYMHTMMIAPPQYSAMSVDVKLCVSKGLTTSFHRDRLERKKETYKESMISNVPFQSRISLVVTSLGASLGRASTEPER